MRNLVIRAADVFTARFCVPFARPVAAVRPRKTSRPGTAVAVLTGFAKALRLATGGPPSARKVKGPIQEFAPVVGGESSHAKGQSQCLADAIGSIAEFTERPPRERLGCCTSSIPSG